MSNAVKRTDSPTRRPASNGPDVLISGGAPYIGCRWLSPGRGVPFGGQSGFTTTNSTRPRRPSDLASIRTVGGSGARHGAV